MTLRQLGIRLLLISALCAPAAYFGLRAFDSALSAKFAQSKLETIRGEIGIAQQEIVMAKARAQALATVGKRAWGAGQVEERIGAAFLETDLVLEPTQPRQAVASTNGEKPLVNFSRIVVRGRGSLRAAKEALWNLGDLGPGIRLESFKGELDPASNSLVWSFVILTIDGAEAGAVSPQRQGGTP
jgi:hypothetical protein